MVGKKSKNITDTNARLNNLLSNISNNVFESKNVPGMIQDRVDDFALRSGYVVKYYPYLNQSMVKLFGSDETVICKHLSYFGDEIFLSYTPIGDNSFCEVLHEPCVIPRGKRYCVVAKFYDDDSIEYCILGFYPNKPLIEVNPAVMGNMKLCLLTGTNQFWIKFGNDGLDLRLPSPLTQSTGELNSEMSSVTYSDKGNVYSKEEVDSLIETFEERICVLEDKLGVTQTENSNNNEEG